MIPMHVHHITPGTPRMGLWCPFCLLPSGYEVDILAVCLAGVRKLATARRCFDCGATLEGERDV